MNQTAEIKRLIAEQKQRREAAEKLVKEAAERVDRNREAKRERSTRQA